MLLELLDSATWARVGEGGPYARWSLMDGEGLVPVEVCDNGSVEVTEYLDVRLREIATPAAGSQLGALGSLN